MSAEHRGLAFAVLLGWLAVGGAACDRTYLTPTHGRAYRQIFAAQTVNPGRQTEANAVHGLDSQESAIISQGYRHSLGRDPAGAASGSQLMYTPAAGGREASMPPPSVPQER
jgi:hypothetical protein